MAGQDCDRLNAGAAGALFLPAHEPGVLLVKGRRIHALAALAAHDARLDGEMAQGHGVVQVGYLLSGEGGMAAIAPVKTLERGGKPCRSPAG